MTLYRVVVLGDGGVGKTALTIQLCLNQFVESYDPTIEDSYRKQVVIDDESCVLEVLDTAGQEEYVALRDQWIRDGEGFVLVYSIVCSSTFDRMARFKDQIYRVKDVNYVPLVLVGNKCDMEDKRTVPMQKGVSLAQTFGCDFYETSAKTTHNVEKAFYSVVRQIRKRSGSPGGNPSGDNAASDNARATGQKKKRCTII
ncbi:protein Ras-2 [Fonticula alba]|uniref:Protein Ras-2 n=1 Tax=Fonticula alba TaxID=691883 RepID=A0A058Z7K2_FONAL|nr:protein Ras-2 [Fonticula alba]KCV69467.1 protein Ras-2 [Fonticula alba]|eukprot:XP_009496032.1 protein Ras-2 [Fonticula alba]